MLITGATGGLGRELARQLAAAGCSVLLHGRDERKLARVASEVQGQSDVEVKTFVADLASLDDVTRLAGEVQESVPRLDALVNNAGVGSGADPSKREESADGIELRMAVNHLAPFSLSLQLMPLLHGSGTARIVNVASAGQAPFDFSDPAFEQGYDGSAAYGRAKLAMISCGFELVERLGDSPITVNSLHPATYMPTRMVSDAGIEPHDSLETGADATLRLISSADLEGVTGEYFVRTKPARAHQQAYDADARSRLWDFSVEQIGVDLQIPG